MVCDENLVACTDRLESSDEEGILSCTELLPERDTVSLVGIEAGQVRQVRGVGQKVFSHRTWVDFGICRRDAEHSAVLPVVLDVVFEWFVARRRSGTVCEQIERQSVLTLRVEGDGDVLGVALDRPFNRNRGDTSKSGCGEGHAYEEKDSKEHLEQKQRIASEEVDSRISVFV